MIILSVNGPWKWAWTTTQLLRWLCVTNLQKILLNVAEVKPFCVLWHVAEIGVQDFVKSIKGVEAHADKVAQAIDGVPTLLQTRSSRLKKLGIPCKQVGPVSFPALCISIWWICWTLEMGWGIRDKYQCIYYLRMFSTCSQMLFLLKGGWLSVVYSYRAFCNLSTDIPYVPMRLGNSPTYLSLSLTCECAEVPSNVGMTCGQKKLEKN